MVEGGGGELHEDAVAVVGHNVLVLAGKAVGKDVVGDGGRDIRHACTLTKRGDNTLR